MSTNFDDVNTGGAIVSFSKAVRKGSHVLIGLYGFSGCGKTLSALYLARGLAGPEGKIGMIDTETGRGLTYAMEAGGYDYAELTPPFTPERYTQAIKQAEAAGLDVLILDSGSHEWEGIGGVLEMAEATNKKGLAKWANPKARHKQYVNSLLNTRMHIIICFRSKRKMVQIDKKNVAKFPGTNVGDIVDNGEVAIQEKSFIFEMTAQLRLPIPEDPSAPRGVPIIEKCPKDLLGAFPPGEQISIATGERIAEWVAGGEPIDNSIADLKREAEDRAGEGTDKMKAWWSSIGPEKQKHLKPLLTNLRSIAATADEAAAALLAQKEASDENDGIDMSDPFGTSNTDSAVPAAEPSGSGASAKPTPQTTEAESSPASTAPGDLPLGIPVLPEKNHGKWVDLAAEAIGKSGSDSALLAFLDREDLDRLSATDRKALDIATNNRIDELLASADA